MKPILIFGASISAAAMAAGFAVLANQAMPPRATEVDVVRPANVAREVVTPAPQVRSQTPRTAARPVPVAPVASPDTATAVALGAALLDEDTAQGARMYLLPPSGAATGAGLATRPVPRPVLMADGAAPLPMADTPLVPRLDPGATARFDYIPLIGVYR